MSEASLPEVIGSDPNVLNLKPNPAIEFVDRDGWVKITLKRPTSTDADGYVGAMSSYDPLPGEDWRRGNDLPDGDWSEETVDRIAEALKQIIRGERT